MTQSRRSRKKIVLPRRSNLRDSKSDFMIAADGVAAARRSDHDNSVGGDGNDQDFPAAPAAAQEKRGAFAPRLPATFRITGSCP
jgi:hypothetical protein